jgi:predicted RNA-binding Zn ribbon-like protein
MNTAALDLINSQLFDGFGGTEDRLDDDSWLDEFLGRWGGRERLPSRTAKRAALRDLRELLRRVVETHTYTGRISPADLAALNGVLGAPRLQRKLAVTKDQYALRLEAPDDRWPAFLAEIAASLAELLADGPERLRVCENDLCRWAYFDESKNRSRRWCSSSVCGNVMRGRRYRQRKRR